MWVRSGVVLDRGGRSPIGVPLAYYGIDCAALDLVVPREHVALLVGLGVVGGVRQRESLLLQLGNGRLELGDGCRDVWQLDDVGVGPLDHLSQLGERVADSLLVF